MATQDDLPEVDYAALAELSDVLPKAVATNIALRDRNTVADSAIGIADTLQSLGVIALSPLPGIELQDLTSNSRFYDQFRSPAYLASREIAQRDNDPNATFLEGALESLSDTVTGGNLTADLFAQAPYLLLGPVGRAGAVVKAEEAALMTGLRASLARGLLGEGERALTNRIALLSGALEGGGGYAQTYDRALEQTGDPVLAEEQATKAGLFSAALGGVLGKLTPSFEKNPTGRGIRNTAFSHLTAVGGELVEEGGLAVGQTVYDNILAGKDPMEGVGEQFGQAVGIAGVFSGGIRSPHAVLDTAYDIGKGFTDALHMIGGKAGSTQKAAVDIANEEMKQSQQAPPAAPETSTTTPETKANDFSLNDEERKLYEDFGINMGAVNQEREHLNNLGSLSGDQRRGVLADHIASVSLLESLYEKETDPDKKAELGVYLYEATQVRDAYQQANDAENPTVETSDKVDSIIDRTIGKSSSPDDIPTLTEEVEKSKPSTISTASKDSDVAAILTDAANDQLIENSTDAEQAKAITRKESLASAVEESRTKLAGLTDAEIAAASAKAAQGDPEAIKLMQAIGFTDVRRLPDSQLTEQERPVVEKLKALTGYGAPKGDTGIKETSDQILKTGFGGKEGSRGIAGYVQDILKLARLGINKPNHTANELVRFVDRLKKRAALFQGAIDDKGKADVFPIMGTETLDSTGKIIKEPFVYRRPKEGREGSHKAAQAVVDDAAAAESILNDLRTQYPKMFKKAEASKDKALPFIEKSIADHHAKVAAAEDKAAAKDKAIKLLHKNSSKAEKTALKEKHDEALFDNAIKAEWAALDKKAGEQKAPATKVAEKKVEEPKKADKPVAKVETAKKEKTKPIVTKEPVSTEQLVANLEAALEAEGKVATINGNTPVEKAAAVVTDQAYDALYPVVESVISAIQVLKTEVATDLQEDFNALQELDSPEQEESLLHIYKQAKAYLKEINDRQGNLFDENKTTTTPAPTQTTITTPATGGLSLVEDEGPAFDRTASATEEPKGDSPGRFPGVFLKPGSTRFENEDGLIDVNMEGDSWQGTKTNTIGEKQNSEAKLGSKRTLFVLALAKAAGKPYVSDVDMTDDSLKLYESLIRNGYIEAERNVEEVKAGIESRNGVKQKTPVYTNVTITPEGEAFVKGYQLEKVEGTPVIATEQGEQQTEQEDTPPDFNEGDFALEDEFTPDDQRLPEETIPTAKEELFSDKALTEVAVNNNLAAIDTPKKLVDYVLNAIKRFKSLFNMAANQRSPYQNRLFDALKEQLLSNDFDWRATAVEAGATPAQVEHLATAIDKFRADVEKKAEAEAAALHGDKEFIKIGGLNWFKQGFALTGRGLFTKSFDTLLTNLRAGNQNEMIARNQQRAAAHLDKYVGTIVDSINEHIQIVMDGQHPGSDYATLIDTLNAGVEPIGDYPENLWMHSLVKSKDKEGNDTYVIHPALVQSLAIATLMQFSRTALLRSTAEPWIDENGDLTEEGPTELSSAMYYQFLQNVGQDTMNLFGAIGLNSESQTVVDGFPKSLASTALTVMHDLKYLTVETKNVEVDGQLKKLSSVTLDPGLEKLFSEFKGFPEILRKFLGKSQYDTIHYGQAPTTVKMKVRNSRARISDEQRIALKNQQQVVHYRNAPFYNLLTTLGSGYTKLLTGFDENTTEPLLQKLASALNGGVTGEINAIIQYQYGIDSHAEENNISAEDVKVFFEYEILRNARAFSGAFTPQNKKTLRQFFSVAKETLDLTDANQKLKLKLSIAQGLGSVLVVNKVKAKTDTHTHLEVIGLLDAAIDGGVPDLKEKAALFYQASLSPNPKPALKAQIMQIMDQDALHDEDEIHSLIILGKYLNDTNNKAFVNTLSYEIDGKTNGPFNAEMLYGLWNFTKEGGIPVTTMANLEQAGLFPGVEGQTIASMRDIVSDKYKSSDFYDRVVKKCRAFYDPLLKLAKFTIDGGLLTRDAGKDSATPLVYGSGIPSLAKSFTRSINKGLLEALRVAIRNKDVATIQKIKENINTEAIEKLGTSLANALGNAYAEEKPSTDAAGKVMAGITTLHAAIRQAIFEGKVRDKLHELRERGDLPAQFDLSRDDYNAILDEIPNTEVPIPGVGKIAVGESTNRGRSGTAVTGPDKRFGIQVAVPRIENPRASIIAIGTIAAGDAAMVNTLFQQFRQLINLYDGIRMGSAAIDQTGSDLNNIVNSSLTDSYLDGFIPLMEWVRDNYNIINDDLTATVLGKVGNAEFKQAEKTMMDPKASPAERKAASGVVEKGNKVTSQFLVDSNLLFSMSLITNFLFPKKKESDEPIQERKSKGKKLTKAEQEAADALVLQNLKNLPEKLEEMIRMMSARQKEGRAHLNAKGFSLNHMAGGGNPVTINPTAPRASESIPHTTTPNYRLDWDESIEAGFDAREGNLGRSGIIALLDGHQWKSRIHKLVWNRIRNLLPADLLVSLAKTEEEWYALTPPDAVPRPYGTVMGLSYHHTGIVSLATADPVTLLHELIHQVITGNLNQYFSNINAVPVALRAPINDLQQLLNRFLNIKADPRGNVSLQFVQGIVSELMAKGDTAAAIDEMVAHLLTNTAIVNKFERSLFERVVDKMKQIISTILGIPTTQPFVDEVLRAFNGLATTRVMSANQSVRASPTLESTNEALTAIVTKEIKGQYRRAPDTQDSTLGKLLDHYNMDREGKLLYNRVWALMRMHARSGALEKYASTVLAHHPDATLFKGSEDPVASLMALTVGSPTFQAQADEIWRKNYPQKVTADSLLDTVLNAASLTDSTKLMDQAIDTMRQENETELSFLGTATHRIDRMANDWMDKAGNLVADIADNAPNSKIRGALYALSGLLSERGSSTFAEGFLKIANELTSKQRWFQDLAGALVGSQNDTNLIYRQVNMMKHTISQMRALFTTQLPGVLKQLFPAGFDGWAHLHTHFGRVDAGVLGESAGQMYQDNAARKKVIKALESKVDNYEDAVNLAAYLIDRPLPYPMRSLLKNATAIANNLNGEQFEADESHIADVDQLITLHAIDMMADADRKRVAGYFTDHPQAMTSIVGMLKRVADEEAKQYSTAYRYSYWKGALPLSVDPRSSVVVANAVRGASLKALGFTRGERYKNSPDDPAGEMYYYVRDFAPPPTFTQGIIDTVQQTSQGVNYTTAATISPEVGTIIVNPRVVAYIGNNRSPRSTLIPVFNQDGDIVGYERMLDRKYVQKVTKSNNTLLHISIGAKLGRIHEERMASGFNKRAVELLKEQWESGKKDGQQGQYTDVASTDNKQIQRAWEVIPPETKAMLEEVFGGPVMIRNDLISNTIGYHKAGLIDIYSGDASLNLETRRAIYAIAQGIFSPFTSDSTKYLLRAETAIKEGVATAKDWIIVRTLSVAYNNATAAINLVIANGVPLKDIPKYYREGLRDLRDYSRLNKEIIELQVKIAGAPPSEVERLRTLQLGKVRAIEHLAIYPLIAAGELSDLPEGLEETPDHTFAGDFTGWLNNHLRKIHPKTPDLVANAMIAKDTQFHNALSKAIQAGDFLGKWAVYRHIMQTKGTPKEGFYRNGVFRQMAPDESLHEHALNIIRDEFIAYGTNPGRFRGALEDYGLVWWSQFTIRAQRVLLRRFRRNPFSFFVSMGVGHVTGTDSPLSMGITERGWDTSTGLDNMFNAPSAHIYAKVF